MTDKDRLDLEQLKEEWLKEEKERRYREEKEIRDMLIVLSLCLLSMILFVSGVMLGNLSLKDIGVFMLQISLFFFLLDYFFSKRE